MSYRVVFEDAARRSLRQIDREAARRIAARADALATEPRPPGCVKLQGHDAYRIRVGDYRVIYSIHDDVLVVLVIDIGHRREVYRGL